MSLGTLTREAHAGELLTVALRRAGTDAAKVGLWTPAAGDRWGCRELLGHLGEGDVLIVLETSPSDGSLFVLSAHGVGWVLTPSFLVHL